MVHAIFGIHTSALFDNGRGRGRGGKGSVALEGISGYSENKAPCVCVEGVNQHVGTHGHMHTFQSASAAKAPKGTIMLSNGKSIEFKKKTYGTAKKNAVKAMGKVFPQSRCSEKCLSAQLDNYHKQCGINNRTTIKAVQTGSTDTAAADRVVKGISKGRKGQYSRKGR